MRARVDASKCQGYGLCHDEAPDAFSLDDWGFASAVGDGTVPPAQHDAVRRAVAACPARAIELDQS